jgi:hypothetical protein
MAKRALNRHGRPHRIGRDVAGDRRDAVNSPDSLDLPGRSDGPVLGEDLGLVEQGSRHNNLVVQFREGSHFRHLSQRGQIERSHDEVASLLDLPQQFCEIKIDTLLSADVEEFSQHDAGDHDRELALLRALEYSGGLPDHR